MVFELARGRRVTLCIALSMLAPACASSEPDAQNESSTGAQADSSSEAETEQDVGESQGSSGPSTSEGNTKGETTDDSPTNIPDAPDLTELKSKLARDSDPKIDEKEQATLRDGNLDLSFELLAMAGKKADENLAVSAVSLRSAFGMVHVMAKGKTQSEIADTMHFLPDADKTQTGLNYFDQTLLSRNLKSSNEEGELRLSTANRMFIRPELSPSDGFLDALAKNYGAGVFQMDFAKSPEKSREKINTWVSSQTFGRIAELFPAGSIKSNTQWVLSNAMYFRGSWSVAMSKPRSESFTLLDGQSIDAESISSARYSAKYGVQDGFSWAEIPLRGGKLKAILLVPQAGKHREVESAMSAATVNKMMAEASLGQVQVKLPIFKIKTGSMDLTNALRAKMPSVFEGADFQNFGTPPPEAVSQVYQSVFLAASQDGVEAAAATGVGADKSDSKPDFSLVADRPFLFLVYDQPSGIVLFVGRVMDPSK